MKQCSLGSFNFQSEKNELSPLDNQVDKVHKNEILHFSPFSSKCYLTMKEIQSPVKGIDNNLVPVFEDSGINLPIQVNDTEPKCSYLSSPRQATNRLQSALMSSVISPSRFERQSCISKENETQYFSVINQENLMSTQKFIPSHLSPSISATPLKEIQGNIQLQISTNFCN